ncbi:unnamed protein product [Meloidogyne enterolobii]|uniref:Uncharacterized protein n=1 Tax=Meloidogyne enterolobii TaxID=390850 RepID=A0ACB0YIW0_MELEN
MIKDKNISLNINTKRRTKSCESFKNDEKEDENENENRKSIEEIWDEVINNRQKMPSPSSKSTLSDTQFVNSKYFKDWKTNKNNNSFKIEEGKNVKDHPKLDKKDEDIFKNYKNMEQFKISEGNLEKTKAASVEREIAQMFSNHLCRIKKHKSCDKVKFREIFLIGIKL